MLELKLNVKGKTLDEIIARVERFTKELATVEESIFLEEIELPVGICLESGSIVGTVEEESPVNWMPVPPELDETRTYHETSRDWPY